ncbi:MAG: hypothetical protein R3E96_09750 [Planctomycetota bacterium]
MNLGAWAWGVFFAGLVALWGALFLLQRLKVRHREQRVLTTLFWHEAQEEARARTLVERFRHPLAYLFIAALASLLWLAASMPSRKDQTGERFCVLVDGSADMAGQGRLARAVERAEEWAQRLPRARTEVLWVGANTETLLAAGEDIAWLRTRLAARDAEACNSRTGAVLAAMADAKDAAGRSPRFVVIGAAPEGGRSLPENLSWTHEDPAEQGEAAREVVALGLTPDAERWDQVDVRLELRGVQAAADWSLDLDGAAWQGTADEQDTAKGKAWLLRGIPANGQTLHVQIHGVQSERGRAALRLPDRRPVAVFVDPAVNQGPLAQVLSADPSLRLTGAPAEAAVCVAGPDTDCGGKPALRLVPQAAQEQAFLLQHTGELDDEAALSLALGEFGLDRIDARDMAQSSGWSIALGSTVGATREFRLWTELLDRGRISFVESRAFPIVVGRALHWLAGEAPVVPFLAAGSPLPLPLSTASTGFAPAADVMALTAGDWALPDGSTVPAALLRGAAGPAWNGPPAQPSAAFPGGTWNLLPWLLALAFVLFLTEWFLYKGQRLP